MPHIVVSAVFEDGDQLQVRVTGKTTYPDALAQMRAEAITAFREAHAVTRVPLEAADE